MMILKDPDKRANLECITNSSWMKSAAGIFQNHKPLVSFQGITEEEHKNILIKMVQGGVAPKDIILR